MAENNERLLQLIQEYRYNPTRIQRAMLEEVERISDGKRMVIDPTNPFSFLMEAMATTAAGNMIEAESLNRKQYPSNATTEEELYLHMSDADFVGIFAEPAETTMSIVMDRDEIKQRAVRERNGTTSRLTIPRHTQISVGGVAFTMQYPIDIRVMSHGGLNITYNGDHPSPIRPLTSNVVDWYMSRVSEIDFVRMNIPMDQIRINSHTESMNNATGFRKSYTINEQFYHCRVFNRTQAGEWEEIETTHTEQVYDPLSLTAALRLLDNQLWVTIPHVYFTRNMVGSEIRIDVYTTQGELVMNLDNYEVGAFSAEWLDHGQDDNNEFSAPMNVFSTMAVFGEDPVEGGHGGLSFSELRERVMTNSLGQQSLPITNTQLQSAMRHRGFSIEKNIDTITNRQFLATRELPSSPNMNIVAPAISSIQMLQRSLTQLAAHEATRNNGERVTLLPSMLYRNQNNVLEVVPETEWKDLLNMDPEPLASKVNTDIFMFSPFHYVLDITGNTFDTRAYFLDDPQIRTKFFVADNESSNLQVTTRNHDIYLNPDLSYKGYRLDIATQSGKNFKDNITMDRVFCQISYLVEETGERAYMTARPMGDLNANETVLEDKELLFRFDIDAGTWTGNDEGIERDGFDLDDNDRLMVTSFKLQDDANRVLPMPLDVTLDIAIVVVNHEPNNLMYPITEVIDPQYIDEMANMTITNHVGIVHEQLDLVIGHPLHNLWTRSRSVIGELEYETYQTDVVHLYSQRVYKRDETSGNIIYEWNSTSDQLEYTLLYDVGDNVLTQTGHEAWVAAKDADDTLDFQTWWNGLDQATRDSYKTYKHHVGDFKLDDEGNKIPVTSEREITRQTDLFLLEGRYYFATATSTQQYMDLINATLVDWITDDIEQINQQLLEQTNLYLYPMDTVGEIPVIVGGGTETTLPAEQSLVVTYYVNADVYANADLREVLVNTARTVLNERLSRRTVSLDDMTSKLLASVGDDVISLEIEGLFNDNSISAATLQNESSRFVLGKHLTVLEDQTLIVEDDIQVNFVRHIE